MSRRRSAFRNQKPGFRRASPPYAAKQHEDPRGWFASRKCGRTAYWWTAAEFGFMALLETDPDIISFEERPERVMLRDGPDWLAFDPLFLVRLPKGPVIVELSKHGGPEGPQEARVARLARAHYAERGIPFFELPYWFVRVRPRASNAGLLLRYLSLTPTEAEVLQARDLLSGGPRDIAAMASASPVVLPRLMAMLRRGDIRVASRGTLGAGTLVSLAGTGGVA